VLNEVTITERANIQISIRYDDVTIPRRVHPSTSRRSARDAFTPHAGRTSPTVGRGARQGGDGT
jgi:hypothetical protein